MGIVDDLQRLEQLRANGTLTEDEFVQAKSRLLADEAEIEPAAKGAMLAALGKHVWVFRRVHQRTARIPMSPPTIQM